MTHTAGNEENGMARAENARTSVGETPSDAWTTMRNTTLQKLWLWKNGDHFWAFDNLYPCVTPDGDPLTLGEPVGYALLKPSVPRRGREQEGVDAVLPEAKRSTSDSNSVRAELVEALNYVLGRARGTSGRIILRFHEEEHVRAILKLAEGSPTSERDGDQQ